ncbi:MAG TPA: hypothetical protein VFQ74_02900 [Pseudolysinimonas sp.]|nr:hypothetical protein [Pseudolysinimonas sp.]
MTVRPVSVRDALGGRWSWHPAGWAILMVPGALIVAVQEAAAPRWALPELLALILLSTLTQSLASGVVSGVIAAVARRVRPIMPLRVVAVMYLCVGVVRGVVGGVVAQALTGEPPQFGTRILVWVIASVVWTPLLVYTIAQIDHRRRLLAELDTVREQAAREHDLARISAEQLRDSILVTLRHRIGPVIDELRHALHAVSGRSDAAALELIGQRLGGVADDADSLMATASKPAGACPALDSAPTIASVAAAVRVELRWPIRTLLLSAEAIMPVLVPIFLTPVDVGVLLDTFFALVTVATVLLVTAALRRRLALVARFADQGQAIASYLLAGFAGSAAIVIGLDGPPGPRELLIVVAMPIATLVSAISVTLAVGVGVANQDLVDAIAQETVRRSQARERSARRDARAQEQIAALTRGPVQGRLAACVMALNFHLASSDRSDPVKTERVTSAVLEHLAAAFSDLESTPGLRVEAT